MIISYSNIDVNKVYRFLNGLCRVNNMYIDI